MMVINLKAVILSTKMDVESVLKIGNHLEHRERNGGGGDASLCTPGGETEQNVQGHKFATDKMF